MSRALLLGSAKLPQISVVLGTFNRADLLPTCIDSIVAQTYDGWELLVVDDGSTDDVYGVVEPYIKNGRPLRYVRHSKRGHCYTKNVGIQLSCGEWVTFMDSDDRYLPEHLSSRLQWVGDHPDVDLFQGGFTVVGDEWVTDYYDSTRKKNIYECVVMPTFFGRRSLFMELGGLRNMAYGEDVDFWERAQSRFRVLSLQAPKTYVKIQTADGITARTRANAEIAKSQAASNDVAPHGAPHVSPGR